MSKTVRILTQTPPVDNVSYSPNQVVSLNDNLALELIKGGFADDDINAVKYGESQNPIIIHKAVHLKERYGIYNAGDVVAFDEPEADRLISAGVAIDPEESKFASIDSIKQAEAEAEAMRQEAAESAKQAEAASKAQEKADKAEAKKLGISVEELLAKRQAEAEAEAKAKA